MDTKTSSPPLSVSVPPKMAVNPSLGELKRSRETPAVCNFFYTTRIERCMWACMMLVVLIGLLFWALSEPELFHTRSGEDLGVCTFVASEDENRSVAWAALTASFALITFSLLVESSLNDIVFHDEDSSKQAWKTTKRVMIREFFIAGSMAIIVWCAEVIYDAAEKNREHQKGHSMVEVFLLTLEFLDKTMLLLMLCYLGLVKLGIYVLQRTREKSDTKEEADRLKLVAVHFFLNFPYYVKVASFVLSLFLLDDIFWPGSDGYYTFTGLLIASMLILLIWLRVASGENANLVFGCWGQPTNKQYKRQEIDGAATISIGGPQLTKITISNGESKNDDKDESISNSNAKSTQNPKKSRAKIGVQGLHIQEQMSWARHTKLLKQFVGLIGCMIATLGLIWVLRMMCVSRFDMPWLLPVLLVAIALFVVLVVSLPQYILFLYTNPMVADPTRHFDYAVSLKEMPLDDEEDLVEEL